MVSVEKRSLAATAAALAVLAATVLAFWPVLGNGFLAWDDDSLLVNNPFFRGFGPANLQWMFTSFRMGHYMPLTWMSYALDHAVWGMNPLGYHLTNLFLHAANAWLVYRLALRLFALPAREDRDPPLRVWTAALAALLFSLHPLRVESVAWATQRRDLLAAFFLLLTALSYLRYAAGGPAGRARSYILTILLFGLSLLSKSVGMGLPVVLLVLDRYLLGRWSKGRTMALLAEKLPFFLPAAAAMALAAAAQIKTGTALSWAEYGLSDRLAQAGFGISFYLTKTILPAGLSPLYEIPPVVSWGAWPLWTSALFAVTATAFFIAARKSWPEGLAAWAVYLIFLAPTLGFLQSGPQFAADRYTYLACLGWAFLAAAGLKRLLENAGAAAVRTAAVLLASLLPLNLAVRTWEQCAVWRDTESLWTAVLRADAASYIARKNLGLALLARERLPEAEALLRSAAALRPARADAHDDLGSVLLRRGVLNEAEYEFHQALALDPNHPEANNNLGTLLLDQGSPSEAEPFFRRAIASKPGFAEARANLAAVLAIDGAGARAEQEFARALELNPDLAGARYNYGLFLGREGRWREAAEQFRKALELRPDWGPARDGLRNARNAVAPTGG